MKVLRGYKNIKFVIHIIIKTCQDKSISLVYSVRHGASFCNSCKSFIGVSKNKRSYTKAINRCCRNTIKLAAVNLDDAINLSWLINVIVTSANFTTFNSSLYLNSLPCSFQSYSILGPSYLFVKVRIRTLVCNCLTEKKGRW